MHTVVFAKFRVWVLLGTGLETVHRVWFQQSSEFEFCNKHRVWVLVKQRVEFCEIQHLSSVKIRVLVLFNT